MIIFDNLHICYQLDRLIKPIDLSITATDTSSPTNEQQQQPPPTSSSSMPTAAALNFFHIKNMIELTVESARLREKQLENEIGRKKQIKILFFFY
jgi:predicted membrane GTPase involved in stress response